MMNNTNTVLLLIDIQMAFAERDDKGVPRSTPNAEAAITELIATCRQRDVEVIHIHHHSLEPDSPFRKELSGAGVQPFAAPSGNETVYLKNVNSAFIGTTLEADLRAKKINNLLVCGGTANHCVETTTRMAGNLGFNVFYLMDCVWAYGGTGPDGRSHSPDDVLSMSLANLHGEFATVISSVEALAAISD